MSMYLTIQKPEHANDWEYKQVWYKTVIDVEKYLKGVSANPFAKAIMNGFFEKIDFEPKTPFPPVSKY